MKSALVVSTCLVVVLSACGVGNEAVLFDPDPHGEVVNPTAADKKALSSMPACHTALQTWDGTTAHSNGPNTGTGYSCGGVVATGYRYQCVELVMRHFKTKWGLRWYGNAKDLLNNAPRTSVDVWSNGDVAHPPVPGDMLVWTKGTWGHVALITAVRSDAVDIIEQNVVGSGRATLSYADGRIGARWSTWVPAGWAHAKANVGTAPPPPPSGGVNWSCANSAWSGQQLWTCSQGDRYRCEAGVPVRNDCQAGCVSRPTGTNDVCIDTTSAWNCANSSYRNNQYWTCSGGNIYRCESGQGRVVRCPSGCNSRTLGTNDDCR